MKLKKIIVSALCAAMVFSLAGCGDTGSNSGSSTSNSGNSSGSSSSSESSSKEKMHLKGYKRQEFLRLQFHQTLHHMNLKTQQRVGRTLM